MKTVTVFPQHENTKTKKQARRKAAFDAQTAAKLAREKQESLRSLRGDSVVVVTLSLCGGTPASPARWVREDATIRVFREDIRPASGFVGGWGTVTHFCGRVTCRLATAQETAEIETLEETQGRDPRPHKLWNGRPIPRAPTYT